MQHTINTKAYIAHITPRFYMNITGSLLKGILQQPVHYFHNVLVVGIRFIVRANLKHLLQITQTRGAGRSIIAACTAHGTGHVVEVGGVPEYLLWVC